MRMSNKKRIWHKYMDYVNNIRYLTGTEFDTLLFLFNKKLNDNDVDKLEEFIDESEKNGIYDYELLKNKLESIINGLDIEEETNNDSESLFNEVEPYDENNEEIDSAFIDTENKNIDKEEPKEEKVEEKKEKKIGFFKKLLYKIRKNKFYDGNLDEEEIKKAPRKKRFKFNFFKKHNKSVEINKLEFIEQFINDNYSDDEEMKNVMELIKNREDKDIVVDKLYDYVTTSENAKNKRDFMKKVSELTGLELINEKKIETKKVDADIDRIKEYTYKVKELELKLERKKIKLNEFRKSIDLSIPNLTVTNEIKQAAELRILGDSTIRDTYVKASKTKKSNMLKKSIEDILFNEKLKMVSKETQNKYFNKVKKIKELELELKKYNIRLEGSKKIEARKYDELLNEKYAKKEENLTNLNNQYELLKSKLERKKFKLQEFIDIVAESTTLTITDDLKDRLRASAKLRLTGSKELHEAYNNLTEEEKTVMLDNALKQAYKSEKFKMACIMEYKTNKTNTIRDKYLKKVSKLGELEEQLRKVEKELYNSKKEKQLELENVFSMIK